MTGYPWEMCDGAFSETTETRAAAKIANALRYLRDDAKNMGRVELAELIHWAAIEAELYARTRQCQ